MLTLSKNLKTRSLSKRPLSKRRRCRAIIEALEVRQLFSLLGISFSTPPVLTFPDSTSNALTYSAGTHDFVVNASLANSIPPGLLTLPGNVHLDIKVDNSGNLTGASTTTDLVVTDSTGTLLTGQVAGFGYQFIDAHDAAFDFRFHPTGGSMLTSFAGKDIGIKISPDSSNFTGSFTNDFQTDAKGLLGPIPTAGSPPPVLTTVAGAPVVIGSGVNLTDTATLAGGVNPTGTITFNLTAPGGAIVDTETVAANGDGNYSTPSGYLPLTVGTYTWVATFNSSTDNTTVTDNGNNETELVTPASPAINTVAGPLVVIGSGASLKDTAVLSGGFNPTGTITFTLTGPGNTVVDTETVSASGDGSYTTPTGYLPTATGSYLWSATYSGDTNNNGAHDNGVNETEIVTPANPAINTVAGPLVVIGSGANLTDTAILTGGFNPTGTITFTLTGPSNTVVDTETVAVSGDGTYTTPTGLVPNTAGSYVWFASYSGDTNNSGASDNGLNETEIVAPASPAINTVAGPVVVIGSGASLTDTAILTGGFSPTGTITFTLTGPGNSIVDTETVTANGDGSYTTPTGYLPTAAGSYLWSASYSGDTNNTGAHDNGANETEIVAPASPAINTVAGPLVVIGSGASLKDTAVLSGGVSPTGTITFTLTGPGNSVVDTETVTVGGDGSYTTPTGFLPTATGSYLWSATYSGDTNNTGASDNGANETEVVTPASPSITTQAIEVGNIVGIAILSDQVTVTGGFNPTGNVTVTVTAPDGTTSPVGNILITGDGTFNSPAFLATEVGTYTFHASYFGDSLNNGAIDNGANESISTLKATPTLNTVAGETSPIVGVASLSDQLVVAGGFNPTGNVTFTVTAPDGTTISLGNISINGDGTYNSPALTATEVGTYTFHATYAGDAFDNIALDGGGISETITTLKASPSIATIASENGTVVGSAVLSDTATISGAFIGTGNITFTVTIPDGSTLTLGSVPVSGNGSYSSPTITATEVGTYTFHASYSGNSLNNGAIDNGSNESLTTIKASPAIATVASANGTVVGSASLSDNVIVSGGFNPSGTVVFTVTTPAGTTLSVGSVTVNGDGTYSSPSITATQVGTYTFHASYSGDTLNNGAIDNGVSESVTTIKASPAIATVASANGTVVGSASLSDSVIVSGGFNPSGTVVFTVTTPANTTLSVGSVTINGDGTYSSPAITATQVGTYTFHASYAGDTLNNGAVDNGANESLTTIKASPAIATVASANGTVVGSASLSDSVIVSGGLNPSGTVVFTVTTPAGTTLSVGSVTINGDGTYSSPAITATQVGTYKFHASYAGDTLNNGAIDNGANESLTTIKASPAIATIASSNGTVVGSASLSDSVIVSGGFNPSGTVVFTVTTPANTTLSVGSVTISGDGTYTSPAITATLAGTYTFHASYAGDTLNNGAVDNGSNESLTVGKGTPGISTTPGATTTTGVGAGMFATIGFWHNQNGQAVITSFNTGSSSTLLGNWMATTWPNLFGASNPYTGTSLAGKTNAQVAAVYLNLWTPSGLQKNTYVQSFAVALGLYADTTGLGGQSLINNGLAGQFGFVVTASGAGSFNIGGNGAAFGVANNTTLTVSQILTIANTNFAPATGLFFGGDSTKTGALNNVVDGINTQGDIPGNGTITGSGSKLTDSATITGGLSPSGTVTFYLFAPGVTPNATDSNNVYTDAVTVNGDGTYTTAAGNNPGGYSPTATGTYQWVAIYSGDGSNNQAIGAFGAEPWTVGSSPLTINTIDGGAITLCSGAALSDTAQLMGGTNPTGTITFNLYAPSDITYSSPIYTKTVTVSGDGNYGGAGVVSFVPTLPGTYEWVATYSGDSKNASIGSAKGDEPETATTTINISGTKFQDITGNGFSSDDTVLGGVTIDLFSGTSGTGTPVAKTVTAADGTYSFSNVASGTYYVQEEVPTGWTETGGTAGYVVNVSGGVTNSTGNNFDDYHTICVVKCFSYQINGCTNVPDISGQLHSGDVVRVTFTTTAPGTVSFVSYTAPDSFFNANDASQQVIFDQDIGVYTAAGTYSLSIVVPNCDYQVDFVCGLPIDKLGPAGSNIFYTPQNRLHDSDNGGTCSTPPVVTTCNGTGSIAGCCFGDDNNNGKKDTGECGLPGTKVTCFGNTNDGKCVIIHTTCDANGNYKFSGLPAGCYKVVEDTPNLCYDGSDSLGTCGGTRNNDVCANIVIGTGKTGTGYNFGELVSASICGTVFGDKDKDGVIDTNETGIAGVKITLTGTNDLGQIVTLTTTTDANGNYMFTDLRAGTYTLTETEPVGYVTTKNTIGLDDGTKDGTLSGDSIKSIVLGWNDDATGYNFGDVKTS